MFFDPTSYTVNENDGTATITVRTDTPGGPQDGAVQFFTEDGTATGQSIPLVYESSVLITVCPLRPRLCELL